MCLFVLFEGIWRWSQFTTMTMYFQHDGKWILRVMKIRNWWQFCNKDTRAFILPHSSCDLKEYSRTPSWPATLTFSSCFNQRTHGYPIRRLQPFGFGASPLHRSFSTSCPLCVPMLLKSGPGQAWPASENSEFSICTQAPVTSHSLTRGSTYTWHEVQRWTRPEVKLYTTSTFFANHIGWPDGSIQYVTKCLGLTLVPFPVAPLTRSALR